MEELSDSIAKQNLTEPGQIINTMTQYGVIIIPIVSLFIAYTLKYFLGKEATKDTFVYFLLEFPVDLFFIGISFITSLFFLSNNLVIFGLIILLISIVGVAITCLLRQKAIKLYEKEKVASISICIIAIGNFGIATVFIWGILQFLTL